MMRFAVLAGLLAGCASGSMNTGLQTDAPPAQQADAKEFRDAPSQGEFLDAPLMHDAFVPQDAPAVVTPDAPPDACVPVSTNILANPALDSTPMGTNWVEQNIDNTYPIITADTGLAPHTAPYRAFMGGWAGTDKGVSSLTDMLYQDVTVPAGTTQLVLTLQYAVATGETGSTVYDTANVDLVQTDSSPIEAILATNNTSTATAWTQLQHTFTTSLAGQTVRLRFTTTNDITNPTAFYFDSMSLTATHCP